MLGAAVLRNDGRRVTSDFVRLTLAAEAAAASSDSVPLDRDLNSLMSSSSSSLKLLS